jgi:tRNA A37 threonylcarbamoyladenosine biosynthesis protein TsaE
MPHHAITVIEWAERIEKFLPDSRIDIRIEPASDTERTITIQELTQ